MSGPWRLFTAQAGQSLRQASSMNLAKAGFPRERSARLLGGRLCGLALVMKLEYFPPKLYRFSLPIGPLRIIAWFVTMIRQKY
jgi:hypothetical protein